MAIIGLTGTLTKIVGILGNHIITALVDPFMGLLSGGLLKVVLPLLAAL